MLSLLLLSAGRPQVPMGLHPRDQVFPRLYLRHLHRYNHVNI